MDRRPGWGSGRRNATTIYLDPLPAAAVAAMLEDLVPGLPAPVKDRIVAQAEGIPLYAIETIRALIDRDHIVPREGVYTLVADLAELASLTVPATLTSLIAARLDSLPLESRSLVRSLSVFRGTFPRSAAGAVSGLSDDDLDALLADLVHRDVFSVRADPLSPQRGQYGFAQAMLRAVAYETLTKVERKALHLAAAAHLRSAFPDDGDEIIDVIAAHYTEALGTSVGDPDAVEVRALAYEANVRAGERAERLGAPEAALLAFQAAAGLCVDPRDAAGLLERAGQMARSTLRDDDMRRLFLASAEAYQADGQVRQAARLRGLSAIQSTPSEALGVLREAYETLSEGEPDAAYAEIALRLGRLSWMQGLGDADTVALLDRALTVGEALALPSLVANGLVTKGGFLQSVGREIEAAALYTFALQLALDHGDSPAALDAYGNLTDSMLSTDRPGLDEIATAGLALARRLGDRGTEQVLLANLWLDQLFRGDWQLVEDGGSGPPGVGRGLR